MGVKAGKKWGQTQELLANDRVQIHEIVVDGGGECSKHRHKARWNAFYVISGELIVNVWRPEQGLIDTTYVRAGEFMTVEPGVWHQFRSIVHTKALEIYYPAELRSDDIEREKPVKPEDCIFSSTLR